MKYNILFPVYNEEDRLENGITKTIAFIEKHMKDFDYVLTIVDNASEDRTEEIAKGLAKKYERVNYIRIEEKGVGAAFRAGVAKNECEIIGYMDIDLSTDLRYLLSVRHIFEDNKDIMMINASKQAKGSRTIGRKWYRNVTSKGLTLLMKASLNMKSSDAICGFKFFRKDFLRTLMDEADASENGWFYIIELLIRAERSGCDIVELPVVYTEVEGGHVNVVNQTLNYMTNINKLRGRLK